MNQPEESLKHVEAEMSGNEEEIWSSYMSWVRDLEGRRHAFRGQADAKWKVQASAYRRLMHKGVINPELAKNLFIDYLRERISVAMMRFSEHGKRYPLEVMAQMQHYGAATGLIDFTESPLVALWFACQDELNEEGRVIAVCLDGEKRIKEIKHREDAKTALENFFLNNPSEELQIWRQGDDDSRMVTQQSLFIFGHPEIGEDLIKEFRVSKEDKKICMKILEMMGITENFIFPDFYGFSVANAFDKDYDIRLADEYYTKNVDAKPKDASHHFQKGVFYATREDYKEAIKNFNKAIEIDPRYAIAYNKRGRAWHALNRPDKAILNYNQAIEIDPQFAMAYYNRGRAHHALGHLDKAILNYNQVIEIDPQYARAYYYRGNALYASGSHDKATTDWMDAIDIGKHTDVKKVVQRATENIASLNESK